MKDEESIIRFKMATIVSFGLGIISICIIVVSVWVTFIQAEVSTHSKDIATLKQCVLSMEGWMSRMTGTLRQMDEKVDLIQLRQAEHYGISESNTKKLKKLEGR